MSEDESKSEETAEPRVEQGEKKPKVKGKRLNTGIRGGEPVSGDPPSSGTGGGTWSCRTTNHSSRMRRR